MNWTLSWLKISYLAFMDMEKPFDKVYENVFIQEMQTVN